MASNKGSERRQLVPRWRPWRLTAALGEAAGSSRVESETKVPVEATAASLRSLVNAYEQVGGLHRATDLVSAALCLDDRSDVCLRAAEAILKHPELGDVQREAAHSLLEGDTVGTIDRLAMRDQEPLTDVDKTRARVRRLRGILAREPRNAVRWVDLGREYLILGEPAKAERAVQSALALEGDNRFILRCSAKFFEHQGDLIRAQRILDGADRTQGDPWLVAAAVAVADLRGASSRYLRHARQMVSSSKTNDPSSAELSGALAMVEWKSGSERRSRQLMRRALDHPTDNVLGQLEWAKERGFASDVIDLQAPTAPRSYEADARRLASELRWEDSLVAAEEWLRDQPFSCEAAMHGSWVASQCGEFERGVAIAEVGQISNPLDAGLANNLAYSLAAAGRLDDAAVELRRAEKLPQDGRQTALLTATRGFVLFRSGFATAARTHYDRSIDIFSRRQDRDLAALASVVLAEEEIRDGSEYVADALSRADRMAGNVETPYVKSRWERLQRWRDRSLTY